MQQQIVKDLAMPTTGAAWLVMLSLLIGSVEGDEEIIVTPNLTYAKIGEVRLQLDLARPAVGDGPFPCIVFIHGGGWAGGNRHAFHNQMEAAARRGYVAATISYRLTQADQNTQVPKSPFPAQIHDCKAAVRWLRAHAAEFHIDPRRIAAVGASAGAHLSLLLGLTSTDDKLEGELGNSGESSRVQAVVNYFGPTDLALLYRSAPAVVGVLKALCSGTPEEAAATYDVASPINYVTADDPPILTLHGDLDKIVPMEQARLLDARLQEAGVKHTLRTFPGQGHGFDGETTKAADSAAWEFLAEHLGK